MDYMHKVGSLLVLMFLLTTPLGSATCSETSQQASDTQVNSDMAGLLDMIRQVQRGAGRIYDEHATTVRGLLGMSPDQPAEDATRMASEIDQIARLLVSEAGGEGLPGMSAVANVIQNRAAEKGRGFSKQTSPVEVISAKDQFEGFKNKQYNKADKHPKWGEAKRIASMMLAGNLQDTTGGATYFHNPTVNPKSTGQRFFPRMVKEGVFGKGKDIGKHRFYKQLKDR